MGTIYRNGVPFVGSGGAGGVEMTQAEYDLLPTSEKMNGAIYFITDGDVSYPSASQMRYDNTESQIPATTVQGAIDENRIEINTLKNGLTAYTDGDWKVRKYPDGTAECWLNKTYQSIAGTQVSGLGWYFYVVPQIDYPSDLFIASPTVNADCRTWGTGVFWGSPRGITATGTGMTVFKNSSAADDLYISIHAIGRWK